MPVHALIGHLALVTSPVAAVLAAVYALLPRSRAGLRWPVLAVAALNCALALWAAAAGSDLYAALSGPAGTTGPGTLAHEHAAAGDTLAVSSLVLLVVVLALVLRWLAPRRTATGAGPAVAAAALLVAAAAVGWTTVNTLLPAVESVWAHHPAWSAR